MCEKQLKFTRIGGCSSINILGLKFYINPYINGKKLLYRLVHNDYNNKVISTGKITFNSLDEAEKYISDQFYTNRDRAIADAKKEYLRIQKQLNAAKNRYDRLKKWP